MKTVMLIFGTRPEAIKMCPLVKELQKRTEEFKNVVCVTGQHRKMLDQVLNFFDIIPDYDLNIMKPGQDLTDVTVSILIGLRDVFKKCLPDVVLVHGDTTTSAASAIAAFYAQVPVYHVEAGLRTYNIYSPWPEEINRQIISRIATYNFSPTPLSEKNLREEKVYGKIYVTGNTIIDAVHIVSDKLKNDENLAKEQDNILAQAGYDTTRLYDGKKLVLITGHRRENFGDGFIRMVTAMKDLSEKYPEVDFVYPMHLNPNVRNPIHKVFGEKLTRNNFFFIEPLQYLEFVYLMNKAYIVLTDSGGIQEEAPGLGKPVLVMRDTTERPEALLSGTVHLVGTDYNKIMDEVSILLDNAQKYEAMSKAVNPYGDGEACRRIADIIAGKDTDRYDIRY
ncbi:MAG: non-hydrolyzing UDP-N-acetylglucosamine 2-epimerase [Candidatus Cryptobacteroides sp.]